MFGTQSVTESLLESAIESLLSNIVAVSQHARHHALQVVVGGPIRVPAHLPRVAAIRPTMGGCSAYTLRVNS